MQLKCVTVSDKSTKKISDTTTMLTFESLGIEQNKITASLTKSVIFHLCYRLKGNINVEMVKGETVIVHHIKHKAHFYGCCHSFSQKCEKKPTCSINTCSINVFLC